MSESCWYCRKDAPRPRGWLFSVEFDCVLHADCLIEEIRLNDKEDPELPIFQAEFKNYLETL